MDGRLIYDGKRIDLALDGAALAVGEDLKTAVLISLFTDRRAEDDDPIPETRPGESGDRRGWWGDDTLPVGNDRIGSRLWLLYREKQTTATLNRAREYVQEALAWLVEDGVASRVNVAVEWLRTGVMAIQADIERPEAGIERFDFIWEQLTNG